MFKKNLFTMLIATVLILCTPATINAQWGGWYNGDTSTTWQGEDGGIGGNFAITDNKGSYRYNPGSDTIYCFLDLIPQQKIRDFLIIEDSMLGKPVTNFYFWDRELMDDGNVCPTPKIGIYLSDNITNLEHSTFARFTNSYIHLPNAITNIPDNFFYCHKQLKRIQIPNNVKIIGTEAFQSCYQLNFVKIPSNVIEIQSGAFAYCKNLTQLYIPGSVKKIANNAFKECKKLTIYCEKNSYVYNYAKNHGIKTKIVSNKSVKSKKLTNLSSKIQVGTQEAYLLFPFIEPFYATNQKLAYISEDPSIAEVNQNGKVEGKKKGETTITVMTTDGSHLEKKVKVTVKKGEIALNPYFSLYQLEKGTTEFNVDAMLYNRNPKATYQIESSDSKIATAKIENGALKVTAKKQGNTVFVVTENQGKTKTEIGSFPISVIDKEKLSY
ncbi:leucine-rich repeat protein [Velocimicrobium porci]|nr:leucine-rich repeat protein [Velocimicrobium porci]